MLNILTKEDLALFIKLSGWDYKKQQWGSFVTGISGKGEDNNVKGWESVLKSLDNSSNLNDEFLNEVIILRNFISLISY